MSKRSEADLSAESTDVRSEDRSVLFAPPGTPPTTPFARGDSKGEDPEDVHAVMGCGRSWDALVAPRGEDAVARGDASEAPRGEEGRSSAEFNAALALRRARCGDDISGDAVFSTSSDVPPPTTPPPALFDPSALRLLDASPLTIDRCLKEFASFAI
jgi:hypothetical protein